MLNHIKEYIRELHPIVTTLSVEIEKALIKILTKLCSLAEERKTELAVSKRGIKTYIFPCSDEAFWFPL